MAKYANCTVYKNMMVDKKSFKTMMWGILRGTHLPDGALHVTPDLTGGVVDELHADLQDGIPGRQVIRISISSE